MTAPADVLALAGRLLDLRRGWSHGRLTQPDLAHAIGVKAPSISSWEKGQAVPPEARINSYARIFGVSRVRNRGRPVVLTDAEMNPAELRAYQTLERELSERRRAALTALNQLPPDAATPYPVSALHSPWHFPAGQAITVVCSEFRDEQRAQMPYSDEQDPDFVYSHRYADIDALIEIYGHLKGANPTSQVHIRTAAELSGDDRTTHLVLLGGIDVNPLTRDLLPYLAHVPVSQQERDSDEDPGSFRTHTATTEAVFRPKLTTRHGRASLREDVALFLRTPNPYNNDRTATLCNGMYARGSFAVVRALTDPKIRDRNADYLNTRFANAPTYSILSRVPVVANKVVVPDWTLDEIRLFEWPSEATNGWAGRGPGPGRP